MGEDKRNRSPDRKSQREQIKEITDQLEEGIRELYDSDRYKDYLTCTSKFHNYSLNNTILIAMQKPDATLVAGYRAWQTDHGRIVRKGERGIKSERPFNISNQQRKGRGESQFLPAPLEYIDIPELLDEPVSYVNETDDHPLTRAP